MASDAAARVITSCPYHKYSTLHLIALYMKMHYIHLSNTLDTFLFEAIYRFEVECYDLV